MRKMLSTAAKEYIRSDHFIHDYLIGVINQLAERLRTVANNGQATSMVLIFWPDKKTEAGDYNTIIMDVVDPNELKELARGGIEKTKASAFAVVYPNQDEIKLVLETKVGTETWRIEKQKRGNTYFFKAPERSSNRDSMDILWKQG